MIRTSVLTTPHLVRPPIVTSNAYTTLFPPLCCSSAVGECFEKCDTCDCDQQGACSYGSLDWWQLVKERVIESLGCVSSAASSSCIRCQYRRHENTRTTPIPCLCAVLLWDLQGGMGYLSEGLLPGSLRKPAVLCSQ